MDNQNYTQNNNNSSNGLNYTQMAGAAIVAGAAVYLLTKEGGSKEVTDGFMEILNSINP